MKMIGRLAITLLLVSAAYAADDVVSAVHGTITKVDSGAKTVAIKTPLRQIDVLRIEFYPHKAAVPLQSDQARRPGTDERIGYQVAGIAAQ